MLKIGSVINGSYKILNVIGRGGMSVVYLAMNERANKFWAVKEIVKGDWGRLALDRRRDRNAEKAQASRNSQHRGRD